MILTGLPSEVSKTPAPGWDDFWEGLVWAWCPFLGTYKQTEMWDYGLRKKPQVNTDAAGSDYSWCPAGVTWKIVTDAYASTAQSGHGIANTWTSLAVIYHAEGSAFSTRWPDFRDTQFLFDSGANIWFGVGMNTDQLWLKAWTGSSYTVVNGATTLPFKQPFAACARMDPVFGEMGVYLDGKKDGSSPNTQTNSITGATLSCHGVSSAGEISPYHVLAHYTWKVAKPDAFIRRISRDWAGPFRKRMVLGKAPAAAAAAAAIGKPWHIRDGSMPKILRPPGILKSSA